MYRKLIVERLDPAFRKVTRIVDSALPVPGATQALVRLCYAGVNASDVNFSAGRYLPGAAPPLDCGFEGVGIVEVSGSKAAEAGLTRGSAVAVVKYGCFAEYVLVDLEHKPTSHAPSCTVYPVRRAGKEVIPLLIGGLTSSIGLEQAGEMKSGEVVMVTGAAGGTGIFAVQLAALAGNRVVGTCGSDDKVAVLKRLGCERAINYKTEDVEAVLKAEYPNGIDLVFEGVGGQMLETCKRCLEPKSGRLVVMGYTSHYTKQDSMQSEEAKLVHLRGKEAIRGFLLKDYPHLTHAHLKRMQDLIDEGKLQPLCDETEFNGLEQVADAVEHLHESKNIGKVVVTISKDCEGPVGELGPLGAKMADCVEVSGLESESGRKLNGQRGVVMGFSEEKGRYAIRFVPENIVNLKPDNIRRLEDAERVQSLHDEVLPILSSDEAKQLLQALRAECPDAGRFDAMKVERLAGVLGPSFERHGVDWGWFTRMSRDLGLVDEAAAARNRQLEELTDFGSYEAPSELDDREKLHRLLKALQAILDSEPVSKKLDQLREACSNKAEFEGAKMEHIYGHMSAAYAQLGVDWGWQEAASNALRHVDQEIGEQCSLLEGTLSFSIGGPLGVEKNECVEIHGLESESGQKLNGLKAFVQNWAEDKGRYMVFVPPDELKHLKPDNLRKVSEKDKLSSILTQSLIRLGTPGAKAELDELRNACENQEQFEAAKAEKLTKLLERIFNRYSVDLGWLFGMVNHFCNEDEEVMRQKQELDKLLVFCLGPADLSKGDCVEVDGLEADSGMTKLNGKRGFVGGYVEEKGAYAVKFPPDNFYVDLKPEFLKKITDKDKVVNILSRAVTTCKQAKNDMRDLRAKSTDRASFEKMRGELLQSLMGGTCSRYHVDLGWFFPMLEHFSGEDPEVASQKEEFWKLIQFDTGPMGLEKNECIVAEGLDSAPELNGKVGFMQSFDEQKGRYTVLFPPENTVNLKPDNLRKCTDREKLLSFQEQAIEILNSAKGKAAMDELRNLCAKKDHFESARGERLASVLAPVTLRCGLDLGWYVVAVGSFVEDEEVMAKSKEIEELISWGTLGPLGLEKGTTCIEVVGLESETGRQMNGQKGLVMKWLAEKERYEVQLGAEKALTLKPANIRKVEDKERLLCLQRHLVEVVSAREVAGPINKLRREATTALQFGRAMSKFLEKTMSPVYERYGVDGGWQGVMLAVHGEDEEIKAAVKQLEELTSWGTVGPDKWEKGCYLEVHGLTSEAGMKLNGMAVFLKGYDDAKGRYDVAPADDLTQTKALKGDNLQLIPVKEFSGIEEATLFQMALIEAYSSPEAKEMLSQLKSTCPNMQYYLTALKPRLLEFQKSVLASFGFRPDFVGQQHMQRALGPYELDPAFLQRNIETEEMLGLPKRG